MANLMINDLVASKELDSTAMAGVYGGNNFVNTNSFVSKYLTQVQDGFQADVTTIGATNEGDGAQVILVDNDKNIVQDAFGFVV